MIFAFLDPDSSINLTFSIRISYLDSKSRYILYEFFDTFFLECFKFLAVSVFDSSIS